MLPGFSYQEQHLTCFVCSLIRVYDHVVARWTLEGALSCPILVPKLSLSCTIAGARSWPRTIDPLLPLLQARSSAIASSTLISRFFPISRVYCLNVATTPSPPQPPHSQHLHQA